MPATGGEGEGQRGHHGEGHGRLGDGIDALFFSTCLFFLDQPVFSKMGFYYLKVK
jgi:hypothetical protein